MATQNTVIPQVARASQTDLPQLDKVGSQVDIPGRGQRPRQERISGRTCELRWFGRGERITLGAYRLQEPMVYVSEGNPREDEASCIDVSLDVGQTMPAPGIRFKTHLSYALLSPNQRANYLQWLSHGRTSAPDDIGFAYLFFCGLERRLLMDQQDEAPILEEVIRLLDTCTASGLFDAYLNLFLAFSLARLGVELIDDRLFNAVFEKQRLRWDENTLTLLKWEENLQAVALARFCKKRIPLPATWALRVARKNPLFPNSIAWTVPTDKLKSLFKIRYHDQFGAGLILEASRDDLEMHYCPVNPSLPIEADSSRLSNTRISIPNLLSFKNQFDPVVTILSRCVDDLRSSSRVLVKETQIHERLSNPQARVS